MEVIGGELKFHATAQRRIALRCDFALLREAFFLIVPTLCVTAIELSRHTGRDAKMTSLLIRNLMGIDAPRGNDQKLPLLKVTADSETVGAASSDRF